MTQVSNLTELRPSGDAVRVARAKFVHGLLKSERWSVRAAAHAIGITNSVLATRMSGSTAFLADEIEAIAGLLKMDPVEFYGRYIAVGPDMDPNPSHSDYKSAGSVAYMADFRARTTGVAS